MSSVFRILAVCAAALTLAACATRAPSVSSPGALPPEVTNELPGMVGLAAQDVRTAYGAPAFVRRDGGDEMWRYDGAGCKAFFFLYPNGGTLAVRHVETLPRGSKWAADPACLNALRAAASPPVS